VPDAAGVLPPPEEQAVNSEADSVSAASPMMDLRFFMNRDPFLCEKLNRNNLTKFVYRNKVNDEYAF